jgi:lipopolysaccharide export system protein LptC
MSVLIVNAPAGTLAGPEREGSTPAPELLAPRQVVPADGAAASPAGHPDTETRQ